MKSLFRHPLFIGSFVFLMLLVLASIVHGMFFNGVIPQIHLLYDKGGDLIGRPPHSPFEVPPLGTGPTGRSVFFMLLQGAKYTIGIAVIVAALRVAVSFILGLFYGNYLMRFSKYAAGLVNSFYYMPISLLCYVLLHDVIMTDSFQELNPDFTFTDRMIFEFIILTIVALPTTSLLIGNQIDQIYKQEFITGVKTLGGSRLHILRKHILPYLWPRMLIQFVEQVVLVLILLVHLGFFHLLFGGTMQVQGIDQMLYISMSSEWSGMIGDGLDHMTTWWWYAFSPLVAFALVILAFNYIERAMEDVFIYERQFHKRKKREDMKDTAMKGKITRHDFAFIRHNKGM